jgi:hypothetical protein
VSTIDQTENEMAVYTDYGLAIWFAAAGVLRTYAV